MLDETEMAVSPDADEGAGTSSVAPNANANPSVNVNGEQRFLTDGPKIRKLSIAVVRVWAKTFKGNTSWAIVELIGASLEIYADLLERDTEGL